MNEETGILSMRDVIKYIIKLLVYSAIVYSLYTFVIEFGHSPELGFYDTRVYQITTNTLSGDSTITYTYTNLSFLEVLARIWV